MSWFQRLLGRDAATTDKVASSDAPAYGRLGADMHSHVLPGLDDGANDLTDSLELLRALTALGYRKLIATPHIMGDFYKNTPEGVRAALAQVQEAAAAEGMTIELEAAAEYYLDEWFVRRLENKDELLSFGGAKRYLLLETSYINESRILGEALFLLKAAGYQPIIAHPERYKYLHGRLEEARSWRQQGTLLQVNLNSLAGYYGPAERHFAEQLIDAAMVDFVGTDAHGLKHADVLVYVARMPYFKKLLALPLRNRELITAE